MKGAVVRQSDPERINSFTGSLSKGGEDRSHSPSQPVLSFNSFDEENNLP